MTQRYEHVVVYLNVVGDGRGVAEMVELSTIQNYEREGFELCGVVPGQRLFFKRPVNWR